MSRALATSVIAAALLAAAPLVRAQPERPAETTPNDQNDHNDQSPPADSTSEIDRYEPQATELERYLKESARELEAKHRLVNALLLSFGGALVLFMLAVLWMALRGRQAARRSEAQIEELLATNRRVVELLETLADRTNSRG